MCEGNLLAILGEIIGVSVRSLHERAGWGEGAGDVWKHCFLSVYSCLLVVLVISFLTFVRLFVCW